MPAAGEHDNVIDFHVHAAHRRLYDPAFLGGIVGNSLPASWSGARAEKAGRVLAGLLNDEHCDALVAQMDAAGIERAVLLSLPADYRDPERQLAVYEQHREIVRAHAPRLIAFAGVDPRAGDDGYAAFAHAVHEMGFRGMKLYPPLGYAAGDERLDRYYAVCSELELPVVVHWGPSLPGLGPSGGAEPMRALARRWPRIPFVLAHAGYRLDDEAVSLARSAPNVYLDLSAFQSRYPRMDGEAVTRFGRIFGDDLYGKTLFGSDWPLFNVMVPLRAHVDFIRSLFAATVFAGEPNRLDAVLAGNAAKILRLARPLREGR